MADGGAVLDLATTLNIRLLSFEESFIKKLQTNDPAIEITVIPPNTYRGVDYPVTTIGTGWVASAGTHIFLAPPKERRWGSYSIFALWMSDVHNLGNYTFAAGLFVILYFAIALPAVQWYAIAPLSLALSSMLGLMLLCLAVIVFLQTALGILSAKGANMQR